MMLRITGSDFFRWLMAFRIRTFDETPNKEDSRTFRGGHAPS